MERSVRSAVPLGLAALVIAACGSDSGKPYAHESMRHPTAAEQMYGTTGGPVSATSPDSMVVTTPPSAPLTVPQPVARVSSTDAVFAEQLAASNAAELELARLAYVRAQSPEVRNFARQMLTEHRDMSIALDNFALERGHVIAWRIEPDMTAIIERLSTLDSASFDRAYMDEMVTAHEAAVARLEAQAATSRETASIANQFLPTVRHHLEMARELDAQL
jgi:putative membrane protein